MTNESSSPDILAALKATEYTHPFRSRTTGSANSYADHITQLHAFFDTPEELIYFARALTRYAKIVDEHVLSKLGVE